VQTLLAQSLPGGFSFNVFPGINLPIGDESRIVSPGVGATLGAEYSLDDSPLFFGIDGCYSGAELTSVAVDPFTGSLTSVSAFAKAGLRFAVLPWLRLSASGFAGGGYNVLETTSSTYNKSAPALGFGGTAGIEVPLGKSLALGLRAGYLSHTNTYPGLIVQVGTVISLQNLSWQQPSILLVEDLRFDTVFPVFYKHYDNSPIGSASLVNSGGKSINDIAVRILVPRFMDVPKTQTVPGSLEPGARATIDLYALLTDEVLKVTEGTKVAARIDVSYTVDGKDRQFSLDQSLDIADRNAMTWDDDRKVASFVTAKDSAVLTLARNVSSVVRSSAFDTINLNLRSAVAMAETLALYGMSYVIDPSTPYAKLADNPQAVDFLQFPRHTLEYRAGDCDDLSILFAALMEAVGIPTAFVTIPGHIYVAFAAGIGPDEVQKTFSRADEVIIRDNTVWVPVEITMLKDGFVQAWQIGAKQWRENSVRNQAQLYPLAEAWKKYPAVGLPDAETRLAFPAPTEIAAAYRTQLTRFIDREIFTQVSRIQNQIADSKSDPRHVNSLGVLYASYGLNDRAREQFQKISGGNRPYAPALVNLGHIHFLAKEHPKALEYYEQAQQLSQESPALLLALARTNHELENYGLVARSYNRLKELDPALATRFAYLDFRGEEGKRAAQASGIANTVVWDE
jgi:tetratricopeptide (TPR) repeat protein